MTRTRPPFTGRPALRSLMSKLRAGIQPDVCDIADVMLEAGCDREDVQAMARTLDSQAASCFMSSVKSFELPE